MPRQAIWPSTKPSCDDTNVTDIGEKPAGNAAEAVGDELAVLGLAVIDAAGGAGDVGAADDAAGADALAGPVETAGPELAPADDDGAADPELAFG